VPTIPVPRTTCDPIDRLDCSIVSLHTVVHAPRQTARTRVVVRARRDGVDRWPAGLEPGVRVVDTRNCRQAGAFLLFDHRLLAGDTYILEYEVSRPAVNHFEHALSTAAWDLVLQVRFHPAAGPARCFGYQRIGDELVESPLTLTGGQSAHTVTLDARVGVYGIRWEWR
jgi:hypothetical protein